MYEWTENTKEIPVLWWIHEGRTYIEKYANKTLKKSFGFNIVGTAISMYALGILIPKIQYAITRKMTNENKFHTEKD